jgi:phosphoadenosine phosphosulfate reductase
MHISHRRHRRLSSSILFITLQKPSSWSTRSENGIAPNRVYKPDGCGTVENFERKYGENLWETSKEIYDRVIKVCRALAHIRILQGMFVSTIASPLGRAGCSRVRTAWNEVDHPGRRTSQGAAQAALQPLEIDATGL